MSTRMVLLCGQSLLLSGIAAALKQSMGLRVVQAATWEEARHQLAACTPDVLIFYLHDANECHILPLLLTNPELVMVGLDTECNRAVLVSGQEAHALTLNQLQEIAAGDKLLQNGSSDV